VQLQKIATPTSKRGKENSEGGRGRVSKKSMKLHELNWNFQIGGFKPNIFLSMGLNIFRTKHICTFLGIEYSAVSWAQLFNEWVMLSTGLNIIYPLDN